MRRTGPSCARAMTAAMMAFLAAAASRAVAGDDAKDSPDARFTVSGQVLDPDGRPVAGARVSVTPLADEKASRQPRATSGADGRFTFSVTRPEVPPMLDWAAVRGLVQVIAEADGFAPAWSDRGEGTSGKPAVLRLARDDVPIEGTIADLEGRPVVGAKVRPTAVAAGIRDGLDTFLAGLPRQSAAVPVYQPRLPLAPDPAAGLAGRADDRRPGPLPPDRRRPRADGQPRGRGPVDRDADDPRADPPRSRPQAGRPDVADLSHAVRDGDERARSSTVATSTTWPARRGRSRARSPTATRAGRSPMSSCAPSSPIMRRT